MTVPEPRQDDIQQWLAHHAARQTTALESIKTAVWIVATLAIIGVILQIFVSVVGDYS